MKYRLIFLFLIFSTTIPAQKLHEITLTPATINIPNRQFHIATVLDNRMSQETIGFVQKGLGNKRIQTNEK